MADQTFDPRLEVLLRDALAQEAASHPVTIRPEQVLERARTRRNARPGWRRSLLGQANPGLLRLPGAVATVAVVAVVAIVAISTLRQAPPVPAASLPTSPADWSRVVIDTAPGTAGIARIAAGPGGLIALTAPDGNGQSRSLFSTDGYDWSLTEHSAVGEYVSVVATDRGFLMIDEGGASLSADGSEWQRIANNWSGDPDVGGAIVVDAVAGGPGYVAVGSNNSAWYSTDGVDWTLAQMPPPPAQFIRPEYPELTVDLLHVAAAGDHLVAAGYVYAGNSDTSITEDLVLASSDGKTWSSVLPDIGDRAGPLQLAAGPNGFLVMGAALDGSDGYTVWQSADGETWQSFTTNDFNARSSDGNCTSRVRMEDVAATSSGYVAVGIEHECMDGDFPASPPQAVIWTSQDGRSWSRLPDSDLFTLPDSQDGPGTAAESVVAWGSDFVIGGMYGGEPAAWISGLREPEATATPAVTATPEATATSSTAPSPISGSMWPQTTLEELTEAQERADAGDPDYTWQLDAEIANGNSPNAEIVDRFIREQLGWDEYIFNPFVGWEQADSNLTYVKCASGETNPMYPEDEDAGECAPTIDDLQYETVSLDLAQPVRSDPTGIWVVSRWAMAAPFAQSDPRVVEASATDRLEEFLEARIAGEGAEGYVDFSGQGVVVMRTLEVIPLLYGTSSGASYERYEIDVVGAPEWPYGDLKFDVRLFADGGETAVEQPFSWRNGGLFHDGTDTVENGQPVAVAFTFFGGQVILTAAKPWEAGLERDSLDLKDQGAVVLVADPLPVAGCGNGPASADADALARSLESNPDLQVTAPMAARVGGVDALAMDVVLAPGANLCDKAVLSLPDGSDRGGAGLGPDSRMRLYLFNMPEGSSMRIMAIAVVAPEARFDEVLEAATPVIDSIGFRTP